MKKLIVSFSAVLLLVGCGEKQDSRTYQDKGGSLKVSGTFDDNRLLSIEINDQKVIESIISLSDGNVVANARGTYDQQPVDAICTISTFSDEPELFCTITLSSKEIATLRFR